MWKSLIYDGVEYDNFVINESGQIKNLKSDHIYKVYINKSGYAVVTLPMGKRGSVKGIRLHKALAEVFIANPNKYTVVHHKDGNKTNYSLDNLEWTTNKLNTHYHIQELSKNSDTPFFNNRKLTKDDVEFIQNNRGKISNKKLAKMFNVSHVTIKHLLSGICYNNGVW